MKTLSYQYIDFVKSKFSKDEPHLYQNYYRSRNKIGPTVHTATMEFNSIIFLMPKVCGKNS